VGAGSKTVLRFIRGTIDPDQMLFDIANIYRPNITDNSNRFAVYRRSGRSSKDIMTSGQNMAKAPKDDNDVVAGRLVGWEKCDIGEDTSVKDPVGRLSLTPKVEAVVNRIRRWYKAKDWYLERRIPWRMGCLFYGIPGTGKSSLVKALAQELNIPIYVIDISTMDNQEFHVAYREALVSAPCIILIEDIDAVFNGRENVAAEKGKGLTFDCLLNTVSGVEATDGALLVVTTNNVERIDSGLGAPINGNARSTRPGRIDCAVELPPLDEAGRIKMADRILAGCSFGLAALAVSEGKNDTGAQFEDRCATMALDDFWREHGQNQA
jgi:SpoVK/Ycf46/Vps4 family AAA+-type ATPase